MTGYSPSGLVAPAQRHAGFSGSCGLERAAVVAPAEWPGLVVVVADDLQDLPGEVGAGGELAPAQQPALDDGKKDLHHVQPGGVHRGAGDVETGAGGQPCPGGPGGVGRPVVDDQVDVQVAGDGLADEGQERTERGRVVAGDDLAGDLAGDHVHRGDQGYGAVPDVLDLAPLTVPGPRPPGRVLAGPGLDAGLLVDAKQHRTRRLVAVQVADRPGLAEERRVVFAVEPAADQVRPDVRFSQDPAGLAGGDRDLQASGQ